MNEFKDYKNYDGLQDEKDEDVQYFCKFTFGQFFTILVLEVITLAFVFYLGAKYGTNYLKVDTADDRNITEIVATGEKPLVNTATALPSANPQEAEIQALARDVVRGGGNETALKDKVRELLAKNSGTQTNPVPEQVLAPQAQPQSQPQNSFYGEQAPFAQTPTTQPAQAEQAPPPAAAQPAAPVEQGVIKVKSSSTGQYSLQIGSYPSVEEANKKVDEWRIKGYPSFMMIADLPERGRWYRVRIGGFADKESAQGYLAKFKSNEGIEGIVVLNEQ